MVPARRIMPAKDFRLCCSLGIGDIILYHNILNNVKDRYDNIFISPNMEIIGAYKNSDYVDFIVKLMNLLFTDPKFHISTNRWLYLSPFQLMRKYSFKVTKPKLEHILCDCAVNIDTPYIVITTKVRALNIGIYKLVRDQFLETIKKLSAVYKIVIIGEREIEMNAEYMANTTADIYSIYEDLASLGVLDLTVPKLGITVPDLGKIKEDCSIMNKASAVVVFGIGGNLVLASGTAPKIIALCQALHLKSGELVSSMFESCEEHVVTADSKLFISALNQLGNK